MEDLRSDPTAGELEALDQFLLTSEPRPGIPLEAVEGLLAAVACGPRLVTPSVWLPAIWDGRLPKFQSEGEAQQIMGVLMRLYNTTVRQVNEGSYRPLLAGFDDDPAMPPAGLGDWCRGFVGGTHLGRGFWVDRMETDDELVELLGPIAEVASSDDQLDETPLDRELLRRLSVTVLDTVIALRNYWRERPPDTGGVEPTERRSGRRVGRNDPCPCGSGQKFKKCCGRLVQPLSATMSTSGAAGSETRLNAARLHRLVSADWLDPRGPIRVAGDLTADDLTAAGHYQNARIFLAELIGQTGTPATAKKNLNRRFVAEILPKLQVETKYREDIYKFNKVINEEDVWPLHIVRVLCELAKLVRVYRKRFIVTPAGRRFLEPGREGELYRLLFVTHFRTLNLAYLGFHAELPEIQSTVAVTLYRIGELCDEWCEIDEDLADAVFLPAVIDRIVEHATPYGDRRADLLYVRILRPLFQFNLLEFGYDDLEGYRSAERVRKTPLYDRFLKFRI